MCAARREPPSPVRRIRTDESNAAGPRPAADWTATDGYRSPARRGARPTRRCARAGTSRLAAGSGKKWGHSSFRWTPRRTRQQQREDEIEHDAQRHRHADRTQAPAHPRSSTARTPSASTASTRARRAACDVARPRSADGVLEEQRVVQSKSGGENQRDQMKQIERHAAAAQRRQHDAAS